MITATRWFAAIALVAFACAAAAQDTPAAQSEPTEADARTADAAGAKAPGSSKGKKNAADRLDLDTTVVTGNRELPKVLYIVPWKKADLGDLPGQPFNTLLDEALTPVDRDVFRREVTYYGAVAGGQSTGDTSAAPESATGKTQ